MKKIEVLFVIISVSILSSCSNLNEDELKNLSKERVSISNSFDETFKLMGSNLEKSVFTDKNGVLNIQLRSFASSSLKSNDFFNSNTSYVKGIISNSEVNTKLISILSKRRIDRIKDFDIYKNDLYSKKQKDLLAPFINKIFNINSIREIEMLGDDFYNSVKDSNMPKDQKMQLLYFNQGILALSRYIKNGGVNTIRNLIIKELNTDVSVARVAGCSIDTRSVVADAVVGFFGGAVSGCVAGATAGTVTFPVVGTVSGCIGAGVVGGAYGFTSGAVYGIASQLLQTCFRNSKSYCDLVEKKYGYNSKAVPIECKMIDIDDHPLKPVIISY